MKFQKAVKERLKARVALEGPTGAGKTWTALEWATILAAGGTVAVIDTEHRSASYYADNYQFDTLDWPPPYDPTQLAKIIKDAGPSYDVLVVDSFTHFWNGEGGTLDMVDAAGKRSGGNNFAGWKTATPAFRHLIDTILSAPCHVICTMRSKMEYILEDQRGRDGRTVKVPRKVGMAPEMRAGIEFEFTVVGELDVDHNLSITKSRCNLIADKVAQPHRAGELAEVFAGWLDTGTEPVVTPPPTRAPQQPAAATDEKPELFETGGHAEASEESSDGQQAGRGMSAKQRFAVDLHLEDDVRHKLYEIVTGRPAARYDDLTQRQRNQVVKHANAYVRNEVTLAELEAAGTAV